MEYINIVFFEIPENMWKNGMIGKMLSVAWYGMMVGVLFMYAHLMFKHMG